MEKQIIEFEKAKEQIKKQQWIELCMEYQMDIIEEIQERCLYKINITKEELQIINEILFEEIKNSTRQINYFECIGYYISDILFDVITFGCSFSVDSFKKHILVLNRYFDSQQLIHIISQMDEKLQSIPCKIIKLKGK